jgi:hypothetical protein
MITAAEHSILNKPSIPPAAKILYCIGFRYYLDWNTFNCSLARSKMLSIIGYDADPRAHDKSTDYTEQNLKRFISILSKSGLIKLVKKGSAKDNLAAIYHLPVVEKQKTQRHQNKNQQTRCLTEERERMALHKATNKVTDITSDTVESLEVMATDKPTDKEALINDLNFDEKEYTYRAENEILSKPLDVEEVVMFFKEAGLPRVPFAIDFWCHNETFGWRIKNVPIRNWKAAASNWINNGVKKNLPEYAKFFPSINQL